MPSPLLVAHGLYESTGGVRFTRKTSAVTLKDNDAIIADTSGGSFVVTLPAVVSVGTQVFINDGDDWSVNNLTVDPNGQKIENWAVNEVMILDVGGLGVQFIYDGVKWNTYGVRVDSARIADSATQATYCNNANAAWYSAPIAASTDATGTSSATFQNNGGDGDGNLAAIGFACNGLYGIKLHLRADGYFGLGGWSRSPWSWYSDASGNMVAAGNVTAYSDPRLKENFERIANPMAILNALDGGTFNWKHDIPHIACKAGKLDYGILADQVEAVMPEIVTDSIDIEGESYRTVAYEKLVPVLIEAVKDLNARIKELEAR